MLYLYLSGNTGLILYHVILIFAEHDILSSSARARTTDVGRAEHETIHLRALEQIC
jgi:hypothetical protein